MWTSILSLVDKFFNFFADRARKKRIEFIENWKIKAKARADRAKSVDTK